MRGFATALFNALTGRGAGERSKSSGNARGASIAAGGQELTAQALRTLRQEQETKSAVDQSRVAELEAQVALFAKAMAVAEYAPDGSVLTANANFLGALGFTLQEIQQKSHGDLVASQDRGSADSRSLWNRLARGESTSGQYARAGRSGRAVWTQSFYGPLYRPDGTVQRIVEVAIDVTEQAVNSRQLQAVMNQIQTAARTSVAGDLTARIPTAGMSTELARLCDDVNSVLNARMVLIRRVKLLTSDVRSAAEEISKGHTGLSQLTEGQAASLEETASSMEQMTSSVKTTADNAAQAAQFALDARRQAEAGGQVVGAAVAAMGQINSSSKKIADIISVIDEIAFQTNLLALNAAVEAARAGEGGRGFAVVASEVRSLAGRSASAAKEIKGLIQDSVNKVTDGAKLVDASGKTLADIVAAVKKVTDIVSMIASSSSEQSDGIEQVNKAVAQIEQATQQNAALVEETAAASQAIVDQVQELHAVIAHYKVDPAAKAPARSKQAA